MTANNSQINIATPNPLILFPFDKPTMIEIAVKMNVRKTAAKSSVINWIKTPELSKPYNRNGMPRPITRLNDKDVDIPRYKILGACNPGFAFKAYQNENKIGTMLPCNVIVQDIGEGNVEVSAVNPVASMESVENHDLFEIAAQVKAKLEKAVDSI